MKATLSLLGLYNYDNTILDGLVLPSNFASGETETLRENILVQTAELEIIYTQPDFLKRAITLWCEKEKDKWNHLKATQQYDYNPIWNADYNIDDTTLETRNLSGTNDTTETFTRNLQDDYTRDLIDNKSGESSSTEEIKNHINERSGDDTTTNSVYSYNNNTNEQPRDKSKIEYDSKNTENGKTLTDTEWSENDRATGGDSRNLTGGTTNRTDNDTTDTGTVNTGYHRYLRGNYGQTTTQQMIKEEQELAMFCIEDFIIEEFKQRFCVLVY